MYEWCQEKLTEVIHWVEEDRKMADEGEEFDGIRESNNSHGTSW